jgi:uncharacterized protein (DUF1330 family)
MSAYFVVDIEVIDAVGYEDTPAGSCNGECVWRKIFDSEEGRINRGDWVPHRFVVLEFESAAQIKSGTTRPIMRSSRFV